jgi:hypothetical protein
MALALQDQNLVWQKVGKTLDVQVAGTAGTSANPASQNVFKALKLQMATQQLGPQLQYVPFSYANLTGATGFQFGISGAFHLYGIWAKKTGKPVEDYYTGRFADIQAGTPEEAAQQLAQAGVKNGTARGMVEFTADGKAIPVQTWPLAYWPDGSLKWSGIATVVGTDAVGPFKVQTGAATSDTAKLTP